MMLKEKKEFVAALFVIVTVLVTLALPYALIEAYGLNVKKLILLTQLVFLVVFSAGMLIWWLVRYRQTSQMQKSFERKLNGRCVDTTNVNVVLLKEEEGVDTNESEDDGFCSNCGRELISNSTGGSCCSYRGYQGKRKKR